MVVQGRDLRIYLHGNTGKMAYQRDFPIRRRGVGTSWKTPASSAGASVTVFCEAYVSWLTSMKLDDGRKAQLFIQVCSIGGKKFSNRFEIHRKNENTPDLVVQEGRTEDNIADPGNQLISVLHNSVSATGHGVRAGGLLMTSLFRVSC
jgi:hypothetical protein